MNCEEVGVGLYLDQFRGTKVTRRFGAPDRATDISEPSVAGHTALHAKSPPRGAWLALEDAVDTVIQIEHGEVWITEEGSFIDHILVGGQHYAIDRPGVAIVSMESNADLTMYLPTASTPPRAIDLHAPGDGKGRSLYRRKMIDSVVGVLLAVCPWRPTSTEQLRPHSSVQLHRWARRKRAQLSRVIVRSAVRMIKRLCAAPARAA